MAKQNKGSNYYKQEDFQFISYIQQYENDGIKFELKILKERFVSVTKKNGATTVFIDPYSPNPCVNSEMIEWFYNRRWRERKHLFSKQDFIKNELEFLDKFGERIRNDYEAHYYTLVKLLKEKLFEKEPEPIDNDIPFENILNSDPDTYINWVLEEPETRESKKQRARFILQHRDKTMENYRFIIKEILQTSRVEGAPTPSDRVNFPYWRQMHFDREFRFWEWNLMGNANPLEEIKKKEYKRIADAINKENGTQLGELFNKWFPPKDLYNMANLIGRIDYLKFLVNMKHKTEKPPQKTIESTIPKTENNFAKSTIEDYLLPFKEDNSINETEYNSLINILLSYFESNQMTVSAPKLFVKNGNKKKLGFALGQIFKGLKNEVLAYEYLKLGKDNLSIYKDEVLCKENFTKSNLYKYYTTKAQ